MLNTLFPISFMIFAIFLFFLSKSEKNYKKLVESNDEKFAGRVNKGLRISGYLLFVCSIAWMLLNSFF